MGKAAKRWGLPEDASFVTLPDILLRFMAQNLTPLEERVLTRILAGWDWRYAEEFQPVSVNLVARQCASTRRSVRRAMTDMTERGMLHEWQPPERGVKTEFSIRPLLRAIPASRLGAERHRLERSRLGAKGHKFKAWGVAQESTWRERAQALGAKWHKSDHRTWRNAEAVVCRQREESDPSEGASAPLAGLRPAAAAPRRASEQERRRLLQAQLEQMAATELTARQNGAAAGG